MSYYEMDYFSKLLKQSDEYGFLSKAPAHILQQKLKDLDKAYRDGFDKKQTNKRLPTLRKKRLHSSFRFPDPKGVVIDNRRVKLPKLGWISFFKSREIKGDIKNITISYKTGCWYMSVQVEQQIVVPENHREDIGIDVGVATFATTVTEFTEKQYGSINIYRTSEKKLATAQRKLKNKKKFSKNWNKQLRRIQRIHLKAANTRNDYLHKISSEVCKNHANIFIEDLRISNMSRSASGTKETPGSNVRAKSGLNKSILDQGWHKFRLMLAYKALWSGSKVTPVSAQYTSQKCSSCGYIAKGNRCMQSRFECMVCHTKLNADVNAAKNILAAGHAVIACGVGAVATTLKQEPLVIRKKIPA